ARQAQEITHAFSAQHDGSIRRLAAARALFGRLDAVRESISRELHQRIGQTRSDFAIDGHLGGSDADAREELAQRGPPNLCYFAADVARARTEHERSAPTAHAFLLGRFGGASQ